MYSDNKYSYANNTTTTNVAVQQDKMHGLIQNGAL